MNNVVEIKGSREAPKAARASMETLIVSLDQVKQWRHPPFQRPIRINEKVQKLADEIKRDGVSLPGVITLGKIGRANDLYIADGQHRLEAFKISGLSEIIADVRIVHFDSMAEMAEEFVQLNSSLVRMRPDDILRGIEPLAPQMARITAECSFVGYGQIRRGGSHNSPMVGMSMLLRAWMGSAAETPVAFLTGRTAAAIAMAMDNDTTDQLLRFLRLAAGAWGREPEFFRLWGTLNMVMCMWLYRRLVLERTRGVKRYVLLNDTQFKQCLNALSADNQYLDFLQGRNMSERDRSPTYNHLKRIFSKRLQLEGFERPLLPTVAWAS